jgi:hypothetical protein
MVHEVPLMARGSTSYTVGVCSPFAAAAITGYLDGRETQDGRFVDAAVCTLADLQLGAWDAAIIFERYFDEIDGVIDADLVIALPEGTAATLDGLWNRSQGIRKRIEAKTEYIARLRYGVEVTAVQSLGEIEDVLPLIAGSPNTMARRIGKAIVTAGILAGVAFIAFVVWLLHD